MKKKRTRLPLWHTYFTLREQVGLMLLVLTGLVLRIINALDAPFWRDEAYILFTSLRTPTVDLLLQRHWDTAHPPLYFLFLHFWGKISVDPFFLRLPSLVTSFFILYMIPVVGMLMWPSKKKFAFLLLFFYTFSHAQISLNMVARPYPFTILFILISLYLFYRIKATEPLSYPKAILFGVVNFFVFISDYSGVWLLSAYFAYILLSLLYKKIRCSRTIVLGLGLTCMLSMFWLPIMLTNLNQSLFLERDLKRNFTNVNPILKNMGEFTFFSSTTESDFPVKYSFFSNYQQLKWSLIVVGIALAGLAIRIFKSRQKDPLPILLFIFPLIISFIFSLVVSPIFLSRNLFVVNIAVTIGMALFMTYLSSGRLRSILTLFILIFYAFSFFLGFPYLHYVDRQMDWDKVVAEILKDGPGKAYIATLEPDYMFVPVKYYAMVHGIENRIVFKQFQNTADIYPPPTNSGVSNNLYFIQTYLYPRFRTSRQEYEMAAKKLRCSIEEKHIGNMFFALCR